MRRPKFGLDWLRRMPLRKFVGLISGSLAGGFAVLFLGKALATWTPVPEGVVPLLGVLGGMFGGYAGTSVASDFAQRGAVHEEPHD